MPQLARSLQRFQKEPTALRLFDKMLHVRGDALAEDVVAEHDDHFVAVDEALAQTQRLGDAACLRLIRELQAPQPELGAIAEQRQELASMVAAGDDHDLVDTRRNERL